MLCLGGGERNLSQGVAALKRNEGNKINNKQKVNEEETLQHDGSTACSFLDINEKLSMLLWQSASLKLH